MDHYYVGIDVGTGSVRAGLVDEAGHVVKVAVHDIDRVSPAGDQYVQSSQNIWSAVCHTVKEVLEGSNVAAEKVRGIGFDATCSLVVVGTDDEVVTVVDDPSDYDIIMWMDHRAENEAEEINSTKNSVLDFVGGKVSLEMELPKLLWLKRNRPDVWQKARKYFDLPDWLVYRATGVDCRSLCSTVCKWNYRVEKTGEVTGWDKEFFTAIGLAELADNDWDTIGQTVEDPGKAVGEGLTERAATELGLEPGTPVSTSLIDAHAGALGMLACHPPGVEEDKIGRLGLVSGTSTCHMLLSKNPVFVPGVWGPFWSAVLPGLWLMEGGQSSTGGLIDHVLASHVAYTSAQAESARTGVSVYTVLEEALKKVMAEKKISDVCYLSKDLHIWPDYHGNRSPLADPSLTGAVVGLTLQSDITSLAIMYLATIQAISYGTRHIIDTLTEQGHMVNCITVCGGLAQSSLYLQTQADVMGMQVVVPKEQQSVLLGAAMLGMAASAEYGDIGEVVGRLRGKVEVVEPIVGTHKYHSAKYQVFREMLKDQKKYKLMMDTLQQ